MRHENQKYIDSDVLQVFCINVLKALSVSEKDAELISETLIESSLAGYDSHGIMRVPRYVAEIEKGSSLPNAEPVVLKETSATAHIDGRKGIGVLTLMRCIDIAEKKAKQEGIACLSGINTNDLARLGSYVEKLARKNLVGLLFVNDGGGGAAVAPFGGTKPVLSTNPLAAGIPRRGALPLVIDISSSVAAVGKIRMALNNNQSVLEGWLIDNTGKTTTDPATFFSNPRMSALMPLGGLLAGHKGFGLGILVDVLAGALGGSGVTKDDPVPHGNGWCMIAIDPDKFFGLDFFLDQTKSLSELLKAGGENIILPGERSIQEKAKREKEGIPVDPVTLQQLKTVAHKYNLDGALFQ